jgi:hypothetical protein
MIFNRFLFCGMILFCFFGSILLTAEKSSASSCEDGPNSFCLDVPFPNQSDTIYTSHSTNGKKDSVYIMEQYVGMAFTFLAGLTALIAVLVIILQGFKIMISGSDTSAIGNSKEAILQAAGGLALLFLAALFLNFVNPTFFKF